MSDAKGYIKTSDEKGSINISQSVVATIAAAAAVDVDGVSGLYKSARKELTDVSTGRKKEISKGTKITIEDDGITVEVYLIADAGCAVNEVAIGVQKAVISAIEEATGAKVSMVNVNVCGVSMGRGSSTPGARSKAKNDAKPKAKPEAGNE